MLRSGCHTALDTAGAPAHRRHAGLTRPSAAAAAFVTVRNDPVRHSVATAPPRRSSRVSRRLSLQYGQVQAKARAIPLRDTRALYVSECGLSRSQPASSRICVFFFLILAGLAAVLSLVG